MLSISSNRVGRCGLIAAAPTATPRPAIPAAPNSQRAEVVGPRSPRYSPQGVVSARWISRAWTAAADQGRLAAEGFEHETGPDGEPDFGGGTLVGQRPAHRRDCRRDVVQQPVGPGEDHGGLRVRTVAVERGVGDRTRGRRASRRPHRAPRQLPGGRSRVSAAGRAPLAPGRGRRGFLVHGGLNITSRVRRAPGYFGQGDRPEVADPRAPEGPLLPDDAEQRSHLARNPRGDDVGPRNLNIRD